MPPQEKSPLLVDEKHGAAHLEVLPSQESFGAESTGASQKASNEPNPLFIPVAAVGGLLALVLVVILQISAFEKRAASASSTARASPQQPSSYSGPKITTKTPYGEVRELTPYKLTELQSGKDFFSFYDFFDGPDSLGSAGYNTYVSQEKASQLHLMNVTKEGNDEFVYMLSSPTEKGPRDSIRLEGKRRFNSGLFILDLDHVPAGCGFWPAFWMTDEASWPDHGEIDIVEGINNQANAKTALHTRKECDMYAHVPSYEIQHGEWDTATGIPDTFTGILQTNITVPADDCWVMAPHRWQNQGCVSVHQQQDTLGAGLNAMGGGHYVLEWDPVAGYIKSWVFPGKQGLPTNLQDALKTANNPDSTQRVMPEPTRWNEDSHVLPYAYFAIGKDTGCSADHFQNMRLIFNLAFCGTVAGNRFAHDCPDIAEQFKVPNSWGGIDPVATCNAYIQSQPESLKEAYWKIKGVYVYERQ